MNHILKSVLFPPTTSDYTFLERYSILGPATDEASCQEHGNMEIRDNQETLMKQEKRNNFICNSGSWNNSYKYIHSLKTTDKTKPSNFYTKITLGRAVYSTPGDHACYMKINCHPELGGHCFSSLCSMGKGPKDHDNPIEVSHTQRGKLMVLSNTDIELHEPQRWVLAEVFPPRDFF